MSEPTTEAGRALWNAIGGTSAAYGIAAVEQEAVTRVLDALAGEVDGWGEYPNYDDDETFRDGWVAVRDRARSAIEQHRPKGGPG